MAFTPGEWFGLDAAGQEQHTSVVDLDYYKKPAVTYERIPKNPEERDGTTIRVGKIMTHLVFTAEKPGPKTYLTPYSPERVQEFLKYAGPLDNHRSDGTRLILEKEGITNPVSATLEQFLAEDFDQTFERIRAPAPKFEDWHREYNKRRQAAEEENHQYG